MDEKRTKEAGMGQEDQSSKQGQTGGTNQPGQSDHGIQPGKGQSQANDWNKEPAKGTPESES